MIGRVLMFVVGVGLMVVALVQSVEPFHHTREYRHQVACEKHVGSCFDEVVVTITGKRAYATTSTQFNGDGTTSTTTTDHLVIRWVRDGEERSHEVNGELFGRAREGGQATLRIWRGQVVGIVIDGKSDFYNPSQTGRLGWWLWLAFVGLGVALTGVLETPGVVVGAWRLAWWSFAGFLPLALFGPSLLANGVEPDFEFFVAVALTVLFAGAGIAVLAGSFRD
ncbi:hypothetical protein ACWEVD_19705 [Nocardia thailandica]